MKKYGLPRPHNYIPFSFQSHVEDEIIYKLTLQYTETNLCILEMICIFEYRDNHGPGVNMMLLFHNLQLK